METPGDTRVSVSLAQLRAELTSLELRLVDRLNGALVNKADRVVMEQVLSRQSDGLARLGILEQKAIMSDGPLVQKLADIDAEMQSLREMARYKKWLWAQTVALCGIAIAVTGVWLQVYPG